MTFMRLYVKPEVHHVPLTHGVVLALQAPATGLTRPGFAPVLDVVIVRNHLGPYEPVLEVTVDDTCRLRRQGAATGRPGSGFFLAGREERQQPE